MRAQASFIACHRILLYLRSPKSLVNSMRLTFYSTKDPCLYSSRRKYVLLSSHTLSSQSNNVSSPTHHPTTLSSIHTAQQNSILLAQKPLVSLISTSYPSPPFPFQIILLPTLPPPVIAFPCLVDTLTCKWYAVSFPVSPIDYAYLTVDTTGQLQGTSQSRCVRAY